MTFKVWRKSVNREYIASSVAYSTGDQFYSTNGIYVLSQLEANTVNVEKEEASAGVKFFQNYPNPFFDKTTISFELPKRGNVSIVLYDLLGRELETLLNEERGEGTHLLSFSAQDNNLTAGAYFIRINVNGYNFFEKLTVIK